MSTNICLTDYYALGLSIQIISVPIQNIVFLLEIELGRIIKIINKNCRLPVKIHKESTIPQTTIKLSLQEDSKKTTASLFCTCVLMVCFISCSVNFSFLSFCCCCFQNVFIIYVARPFPSIFFVLISLTMFKGHIKVFHFEFALCRFFIITFY